jgi:hypothetical protein
LNTDLIKMIQYAKSEIQSFSLWMDERVEPLASATYPLELSAWRKELALIRPLIEAPDRLRIALVGATGAGKSTFLNAILGQEVLPIGVMQPCTAFVTAVSHSSEPGYRVTVRFCTSQEWQADLESLILALKPGDADEESDGRGESKRLMDAARKRIQAVLRVHFDDDSDPSKLLKASLPPEVEKVFTAGSSETNAFNDAKEMLAYLKRLIRGDSALWPLVKQVEVSGPYECLAGGLELVDLPGLNDPNEARVEVTREFLRTSPFVWVVFSMVRGLTEDIQRILREEKLLRVLVLSGSYGALSLVGTKADDIDTNIADQLGLPEDCTGTELVRTYRDQTVNEARKQLEQMVRDLASRGEEGDTLARMVEVARHVRVHTTSANAYNKLMGIGRLRKDYGLTDIEETGIPAVHDHLTQISRKAGGAFNAEAALKRLDQLGNEIAFFFRAKARGPAAEVDQARTRFQRERDEFSDAVQSLQGRASDQLKLRRKQFLETLDPILSTSVQGVQGQTDGWRGIHWATLRAIVNRHGAFKSPTTGRAYDLNEDLAGPLLAQLPVSWERYFTDDLGQVTCELVIKLTESSKNYCGRIRLIVELLFHRTDKNVEQQLSWFQEKVSLLADAAQKRLFAAVRERRSELAAKMPLVAQTKMQSGYDSAKVEKGTGMKGRMLEHITPLAIASAQPIYSTIQSDLVEGLNDLEMIISGMFRELTLAAEDQARIVSHNANIDVDEVAIDPTIIDLLASIPGRR